MPVTLRCREFLVLAALVRARGNVMSHVALTQVLYGDEEHDADAVKTHVSRLRTALAAAGADREVIHSVRGVGYRLDAGGTAGM